MNKEELLGKLYTLRAGLSLVAKEKDKMLIEENKVNEIDNEINKVAKEEQSQLDKYNEYLDKKNKTRVDISGISKTEERVKDLENSINNSSVGKDILWAVGKFILSAIICLIAIGMIFGNLVDKIANLIGIEYYICIIVITALVSISIGLHSFISDRKSYKRRSNHLVTMRKLLDAETNQCNNKSNNEKETLQNYADHALNKSKEQTQIKNALITKKNAQIEECKKINAGYKQIGTALYTAIVNEYKGLIDARDFKNVDLLIYFIETNRADDLKEALHQVDIRTQTDEIVNAIHEATETITNNIRMGFNVLSQQINYEFDALNTRISDALTTIDANNALFDKNLHIINDNIKELCTAQNAQNALLEKADVSSTTLVNDIKYITNYNYK